MKVLISSDLEGISGIDDYRQIFADVAEYNELYEKARNHITDDVNAAIRGLRRGGATEIDVIDGHGYGAPPYVNIIREKIESGIRVIAGCEGLWSGRAKPFPWESYDAQVLVGYHAMAGTLDGFLSHTVSGLTAVKMNGRYVGEAELSAWDAGHYNVPTILVTGDAAVVREAKSLLPGIEGVIVKTASSRNTVRCLPVDEVRSLIQRAASDALRNLKKFKPFRPSTPIHLDVVFSSPEYASLAAEMPRSKLTDNRTVSYIAEHYPEAMAAFLAAISLALVHRQRLLSKRLEESKEAKRITEEWLKEIRRQWVTEPPPFPPMK